MGTKALVSPQMCHLVKSNVLGLLGPNMKLGSRSGCLKTEIGWFL